MEPHRRHDFQTQWSEYGHQSVLSRFCCEGIRLSVLNGGVNGCNFLCCLGGINVQVLRLGNLSCYEVGYSNMMFRSIDGDTLF